MGSASLHPPYKYCNRTGRKNANCFSASMKNAMRGTIFFNLNAEE
ncbi:Uncharacterized protein dnm_095340 [Desulfonema magnum]|uniref:Uncharacterized protein n=1 Tax=Desulfonema magnum TaxID=45655 RepID=A0A975GVB8_9BACT|nr:Uncharacterized protein dnm_095340 [Desulfonema magnum]